MNSNWDGHQWDGAGSVTPVHVGCCRFCERVRQLTTVIFEQPVPGQPRSKGARVCGDCAPVAVWAAVQSAVFSGPLVRVLPISKAVA
ncbi:hypothetical protein [Kibdelosporangium phytohabitans]|uniref:Uncharacterized protein n=1 Tax=Kibdelosporangium phytohabitans TaxID=860235 RepID=A0A0N9HQ52_9PSEU|nr:hypothetical protein [Kibdelosporangium phytohabitans]ALG06821.1 hypothetical protein AOZ06_07665 [Kibdelosporangium phytohabitans]MBE1468064.1 hypothetical protein [Kibdelosporangium phytohabitans]